LLLRKAGGLTVVSDSELAVPKSAELDSTLFLRNWLIVQEYVVTLARFVKFGGEFDLIRTEAMKPSERDRQFEVVVRECHSGLRFFIRSLGVDEAWVDDLAQETLLLAYRKWDNLDDPANAMFWLRRIARNLVLNEVTKTSRRKRLLDEKITDYLLTLPDDELIPGQAGDNELRLAALRYCIGQLSDRIRRMLTARYEEDQSAMEIGDHFSMEPSAVRKALFVARKKLAECLGERGVTEFRHGI
jgi:RNA polymerase sigma-70 factor, ECF subfamily